LASAISPDEQRSSWLAGLLGRDPEPPQAGALLGAASLASRMLALGSAGDAEAGGAACGGMERLTSGHFSRVICRNLYVKRK